MRIGFSLAAAALMLPVSAGAAVMLPAGKAANTSCYLDMPGCGRSIEAAAVAPESGISLPDPVIPALIGVVIVGLALGRRRPNLVQVSS